MKRHYTLSSTRLQLTHQHIISTITYTAHTDRRQHVIVFGWQPQHAPSLRVVETLLVEDTNTVDKSTAAGCCGGQCRTTHHHHHHITTAAVAEASVYSARR